MPALEFLLAPADAARLARWPGLRGARAFPLMLGWFDTADHALAERGLVLSPGTDARRKGPWRLTALRPPLATAPPAVLSEAMEPALLDPPCPDGLQRRAGLTGTQRRLRWQDGTEDVALRLIEGRLDGQAAAACRLTLDGPAASVGTLAASMAAGLDLQVPRATLAAVALAGVAGVAPPPGPRARRRWRRV